MQVAVLPFYHAASASHKNSQFSARTWPGPGNREEKERVSGTEGSCFWNFSYISNFIF